MIDINQLSSEHKPVSEVLSKCSKDISKDVGVVNSTDLLGDTLQVSQSIHVEEESKIMAASEDKNEASTKKEESKHSSSAEPNASHITSYEIKPMNYEEIHQFFDEEESDHEQDGGHHSEEVDANEDKAVPDAANVDEPDAAFYDKFEV